MAVHILHGDCLDILPIMASEGLRAHAVVTDPPYEMNFMGKKWDNSGVSFRPETWAAVMECMRPGAYLVAFGGTRTFHRIAVAIEDAGFEIRDTLMWLHGQGFPKSHDVSKGIDKAAGVERDVLNRRSATVGFDTDRQGGGGWTAGEVLETVPATPEAAAWSGWGTSLKPAWEPIILARKPLIGTVAANVLAYGTGALNIDASRVDSGGTHGSADSAGKGSGRDTANANGSAYGKGLGGIVASPHALGRWPANVVHDGSEEVEAAFAVFGEKNSARANGNPNNPRHGVNHNPTSYGVGDGSESKDYRDTGTASRFFYCAKASPAERNGSNHPTVKPLALMRWLVTLVTPPGGLVLDPFAGTGPTGQAADQSGMNAILIERSENYVEDAKLRMGAELPVQPAEITA